MLLYMLKQTNTLLTPIVSVIFVHEVKKDGFVFWVGVNGGKEGLDEFLYTLHRHRGLWLALLCTGTPCILGSGWTGETFLQTI